MNRKKIVLKDKILPKKFFIFGKKVVLKKLQENHLPADNKNITKIMGRSLYFFLPKRKDGG